MTINPRFIEYFRDTFFHEKPEEMKAFLESLEKGIPRTIRIQSEKIKEVRDRLETYGFILGETYIPNVFTLNRREDFDPLERRIGYTLDHLVGNFYIQELAAATSVHKLSDGKVQDDTFTILDMAASPGGKTTQLAEMYPNSFIIANEPTRERIPQLLQNLDRMGSTNIGVTLYPGQFFHQTPEVFDRILLDAPCSGEGTLFKGTLATKHWHIKNIKTIARLQEKLLAAAISSLKVGGEMVYSTCSMNLIENEGVIDSIMKRYPNIFRVVFQKHFWPHIDGTGGFFVAKITKFASIEEEIHTRPEVYNTELILSQDNKEVSLKHGLTLYEHTGKLLAVKDHPNLEYLRKKYFFMRFGEKIGQKNQDGIVFDVFAHRSINVDSLRTVALKDEEELDKYLRGSLIECKGEDGPIILTYLGVTIGIENILGNTTTNNFPTDWRRK